MENNSANLQAARIAGDVVVRQIQMHGFAGVDVRGRGLQRAPWSSMKDSVMLHGTEGI